MNKKILLSIGSIAAVVAPAVSVISCGDEEAQIQTVVKSISSYDARITIPGQKLTADGKLTAADLEKIYDEFKNMRGFKYVLRYVVVIPLGQNKAKRLIYTFQTPPTKAELSAKSTTVVAEDIDPTTPIDLPAINNLDIDDELAKFTKTAYTTSMTITEAQETFATKNSGFVFTPEHTPITDGPTNLDQYTGISFILAQRYIIGDAILHVTLKLTNLHDSRQEATKNNVTISLKP